MALTEFRRPALASANPTGLSEFLRAAGILASIRFQVGDAAYITADTTANALDTALVSYVDDPNYRDPLPSDLPAHVQHLQSYLAATPQQIAALTQAQKDHVLQDCVRALKGLVNSRLA